MFKAIDSMSPTADLDPAPKAVMKLVGGYMAFMSTLILISWGLSVYAGSL